MVEASKSGVRRISVSLPEPLWRQFNAMLEDRNCRNCSQVIAELINDKLVEHAVGLGDEVMAGTITLVYDNSTGLQKHLADLQYEFIDEVISSLHINLTQHQTMEVVLVQGPARKLQCIADKMGANRGVITCKLQVTTAVIPPIHPKLERD
ncbi:MAG: nickel-responsive transcriptional regulator NikR [Gammaproteobacteria bacterium]|nr:nickel-responsive transcriptional regulator NikR [Gammaproteobacteria bacterium]MBI5615963.1 nickel-responsive transcriptional regulator NikR [Gammaproteobacteria bacterium]